MSKFVGEIFLLAGVGIGALIVWLLIKGMRSKNWPTAPGVVLDSQVTMHYDDEGTKMYGVALSYRYDVDGLTYDGNKRTFGDYSSNNRGRAEKIIAQYQPGSAVQVHYKPEDPSEAVLEPGMSWFLAIFLIFPVVFIGIGVAILFGWM